MYIEYQKKLIEIMLNVMLINNKDVTLIKDYEVIMETLINIFEEGKTNNSQVFFIGNGGSAGIAEHMTTDFMKNAGIGARSMFSSTVLTCFGNDYTYKEIFSKQLELLAQKQDILVAISSSGNSLNIINAIEAMRKKGGKIITFTGFKEDNKVKGMGDYNIYVPIEEYGIVETIHQAILQQVVDELKYKYTFLYNKIKH